MAKTSRILIAPLLSMLLLSSGLATTSAGAATSSVVTTVTTTAPIFEFYGFFGPSQTALSCQLTYNQNAYCESYTPSLTHNATVTSKGVVTTCVGASCGSNAGIGTPDLGPRTLVRAGNVSCLIGQLKVTCTNTSGKGFVFTAKTITKLG